MAVILETSLGDITVDLYTEERPRCCLNFLKLCKIKYYNFCLFHSVQRNLVAQTGDPSGSGRGGSSVFAKLYGDQARFFDMEVKPRIKHQQKGLVSMVNNGADMHGSQFFITLDQNLDYLDGIHTVFGEVTEGFETLSKINEAYVDKEHRPYIDIRIYHTLILDDPYNDPTDLQIPDRSPEPTKEQLESGRIGADEEIDDTKGKSVEEVVEMTKEKEAKANAQILTMIGDLPEEDTRPPDNVLFVCKLNPVTSDEDLEIIFSRFGNILSCEVIKDHKTGESLQYAFVEFEKPEECENAYFKMDNVLIDDRRIHVDFSQSVAKVKWKGKGKGVEYQKIDKPKEDIQTEYKLKEKSKRGSNYDLVYEDDDNDDDDDVQKVSKKKKKKKKHKHKGSSRSRSGSREIHKHEKKHKLSKKSRSGSHSPKREKKSRSATPKKSRKKLSRSSSSSENDRSPSPVNKDFVKKFNKFESYHDKRAGGQQNRDDRDLDRTERHKKRLREEKDSEDEWEEKYRERKREKRDREENRDERGRERERDERDRGVGREERYRDKGLDKDDFRAERAERERAAEREERRKEKGTDKDEYREERKREKGREEKYRDRDDKGKERGHREKDRNRDTGNRDRDREKYREKEKERDRQKYRDDSGEVEYERSRDRNKSRERDKRRERESR